MERRLLVLLAFISCLLERGLATTTSTAPTPSVNSCGNPPRVSGSTMTRNGTMVRYVCTSRRAMQGSQTIQCINSNWTSPPQCIVQYCPVPPLAQMFPNSRRYWSRYNRGYVGRGVSYYCNSGYQRVGVAYRTTCQSNFTWSPLNFRCTERECGNVPEIANGVNISVTSTSRGGVITYKCNTGYFMRTPRGERSNHQNYTYDVTCQARSWNSVWGARPQCYAFTCGESPTVLDASKRVIGENIYQDTVIYECPMNFDMTGNNTITCGEDAKWTPEPSCKMSRCSKDPGYVPNGSLMSLSGHSFGDRAGYQCLKGYHTVKPPFVVCMRNRNWTSHPECKAVDCGIPPVIHFGSRKFSTTTYGSRATYSCEDEFTIIGIEYIRCRETGQWEESPLCEPMTGKSRWNLKFWQAAVGSLTSETSSSSSQTLMIILSAVFALLSVLLIILVVTLFRVYEIQCRSSTPCCVSGSVRSLTKPTTHKPSTDTRATSFAPEDLL